MQAISRRIIGKGISIGEESKEKTNRATPERAMSGAISGQDISAFWHSRRVTGTVTA